MCIACVVRTRGNTEAHTHNLHGVDDGRRHAKVHGSRTTRSVPPPSTRPSHLRRTTRCEASWTT
eukprot:5754649-Prymnesium_polylepis.1